MLKAIGAFLLVFWLLSMVVQASGLEVLFAVAAAVLFGLDLLISYFRKLPRTTRVRRTSLF